MPWGGPPGPPSLHCRRPQRGVLRRTAHPRRQLPEAVVLRPRQLCLQPAHVQLELAHLARVLAQLGDDYLLLRRRLAPVLEPLLRRPVDRDLLLGIPAGVVKDLVNAGSTIYEA